MSQSWFVIRLAEHIEAHIVIGFGGRFWLLLFFLGFLSGTTGGSSTSSGGSSTNTGADVGDQLGDVAVLEGTGEESGPEGLNFDVGGLKSALRDDYRPVFFTLRREAILSPEMSTPSSERMRAA